MADGFMALVDEALRWMKKEPYTEKAHRHVQMLFDEQEKILRGMKPVPQSPTLMVPLEPEG